jgi:diguanylate cyclase (GGDEF)-like protein
MESVLTASRTDAAGPPVAWRLLSHVADLAALQDADAIARTAMIAALDVVDCGSAAVAVAGPCGALKPVCAAGPLATDLARADHEALVAWLGDERSFVATAAEPTIPAVAALRDAGARALAAVALRVQGEVRGLLLVAGDRCPALALDGVDLLEELGAATAAGLRNAELLRELRERAARDALTGLGHHATFHQRLRQAHRRPTTAVVLCDVDEFKALNDTYGHGHGDRVLRGIADAMTGALRRGDELFRIGGDEFAALVVVGSEAEALDAARRLRDAVRDARLGVTMSLGVAVPRPDEPDAELLARADRALYAVKESGRDGVELAADAPVPAAPPAR